ncbi:RagB/SusD family nutrient uptake outer membrane protein [Flavivirga abyssicola]|uniref:RagB/SusD family nutrient uptake outer membrane protein n=1 Tax=Flavivirga abyssicola TaxID=3063533 RepID=UPI0026DFD6D4|nr:RagB/SusD family nutrient uptake outer membrane protein [Flavivirga sp. MEBiC07777]WVK14153.1 RagB/SusD family nutrient uptake outer membrane protein [Flavivirga sp. MEBiC07777]
MKKINHFRRKYIIIFRIWKLPRLLLLIVLVASCEDFVEVDLPINQLTSATVFEETATAEAALNNIYSKMRGGGSVAVLSSVMGLYADELDNIGNPNPFYEHTVSESNAIISTMWNSTYNLIYAANDIIEGIENSKAIELEDKNQLQGEALFIRAYLHTILVELFGPIPYISTTDYIINTTVLRMPVDEVYNHIINDLMDASGLLGEDISGERIRIYRGVVDALLARVYLYSQQWEFAEAFANNAINEYILELDLNKVFLKDASGTIWQIKPHIEGQNTRDAGNFILDGRPVSVAFSDSMKDAFEPNDQREVNWVGSFTNGVGTFRYAFKYKQNRNTFSSNGETLESKEYPIVFRLAEQYLIRAEARAQQENITGAQADLNIIRNRAGLPNTTANTANTLLDAILQERQVELFTEQGQRWFDLKRTGNAIDVLAPIKSNWRDTNILLPIPELEFLRNPNLLPQNDGYN